jgi:prepilin-type N-terminal cleavage/methylation domain-containing protein
MIPNQRSSKGFTLVELIVVIAILAILISVAVPAFTRFIDQGRFSDDTQRAASMTSIIQAHAVTNDIDDAEDVRNIIDMYNGSPFDYETKSSNCGFFYLENRQVVIATKFDDVSDIEDGDGLFIKTRLLSDTKLDQSIGSPEELFGSGKHLISKSGSPIADLVRFVRNMADSGDRIQEDYDLVKASFESFQNNAFIRFFTQGPSDETVDTVEAMLEAFNPTKTLFVNNVNWATAQSDGNQIERIVFKAGISNVPTFDVDLEENIVALDHVHLPNTIRTIQARAFPSDSLSIDSLNFRDGSIIKAEADAFTGVTHVVSDTIETGEIDLIDYSSNITITLNQDGSFEYDFSGLPIRNDVTGYVFDVENGIVNVKIMTKDGMVGFATNAYTVKYYLDIDDRFEYFEVVSSDNTFIVPPVPAKVGYTFGGWYIDNPESVLSLGEILDDQNTIVYAKWN